MVAGAPTEIGAASSTSANIGSSVFFFSKVDDEVLVIFEHSELRYPMIIEGVMFGPNNHESDHTGQYGAHRGKMPRRTFDPSS